MVCTVATEITNRSHAKLLVNRLRELQNAPDVHFEIHIDLDVE